VDLGKGVCGLREASVDLERSVCGLRERRLWTLAVIAAERPGWWLQIRETD